MHVVLAGSPSARWVGAAPALNFSRIEVTLALRSRRDNVAFFDYRHPCSGSANTWIFRF